MNKKIIWLLVLFPVLIILLKLKEPLFENLSYTSSQEEGNVIFLNDLTYQKNGKKEVEQSIFNEIFNLIDESEEYLVVDMFLYNNDYDYESNDFPELSRQLTDKLIEKKVDSNIDIIVITDSINNMYNAYEDKQFIRLKEAGIDVVVTDLSKIRDSNPIYSGFYRAYLKWYPNLPLKILPNLFNKDKPKANLASYFSLLNFKANHRKVIVNEKNAIISSANPHDGSYYHSNVAVKVNGPVIKDILKTETAVISMSGHDTTLIDSFEPSLNLNNQDETVSIKLTTEGKTLTELIHIIEESNKNDDIKLGMFYLSERKIINALKEASNRGVNIQIILDQNKDAFGKKKIGIPNKQVASELIQYDNIEIKWYETQGEQYHSKFLIHVSEDKITFGTGSANFTRRNLRDYNLEINVFVQGSTKSNELDKVLTYYERIWNNEDGIFTSDYELYEEQKWWKDIIYYIQEVTGLSTF